MKTINPLETIEDAKDLVFLAGPCPRTTQTWNDWREEMCNELTAAGFNGDVVNPTNPNYDKNDPDYYDKQCSWERLGLHMSSLIVFWIDRNDEHPALTTNIEFGIWSDKSPQSLVVGIPEGSQHCDYIKWVCKEKGISCFNNMKDVAREVVSRLSKPTKVYFTSDTHFSSDRHLELSRRPFKDVEEMDRTFISNWNKTVTSNDIVVHLGDFGNPDIVRQLNFKQMIFLNGNYERKEPIEFNDDRVIMNDSYVIEIDGERIQCVHEPLCDKNSGFYLFGHIHEKNKVKRNGFNVSIDANNFIPVSIDTIRFYMNAIKNFYDENVFCESCE